MLDQVKLSKSKNKHLLLFRRASGMNVVVVLLLAAAVALSKVVDSEAMVSNVKEGAAD